MRYRDTRHNVGFWALDQLAEDLGASSARFFKNALIHDARLAGEKIILAKPQSFMNRSGYPVRDILAYFKISPGDLIVIHDDMDIEVGRLRIRDGGGHGGHRGVASIVELIGDRDFCRLKIGIGRPPEGFEPSDYVLSTFKGKSREIMRDVISVSSLAFTSIITEGLETAMNKYNSYGK